MDATESIVAGRMNEVLAQWAREFGIDPGDLHLKETPARFATMMTEMLSGYKMDPKEILTVFPTTHHELITSTDIKFYSTCPHHLAPYAGVVDFGYIPEDWLIGLSKISRLVECFARRLQLQEDLATEIVDNFMEYVRPQGCIVHVRGRHNCVCARGARNPTMFSTTAARGVFMTVSSTKEEFYHLCKFSNSL